MLVKPKENSKVYSLPMTKDYVSHWSTVEAVREIIQNAIDFSEDNTLDYNWSDNQLSITSYCQLEPKTLLLGCSSKQNDSSTIGKFGEGYKLAMLVLTRLGKELTIYNGSKIWEPYFTNHQDYDVETLHVSEFDNYSLNDKNLVFEINNLTDLEAQEIKDSCLQMQDSYEYIKVEEGEIIESKSGQLYINGLFICKTQLQFGYNIKPEFLTVERDRQTVDGFNLKWLTKDMWSQITDYPTIAALMESNCPDLEYFEHNMPILVKEACYQRFIKEHPGAVCAKSQAELDMLIKRGLTKTIIVNPTYHHGITSCKQYKHSIAHLDVALTPKAELEKLFRSNKQYMRKPAIIAMKKLINSARQWRN